MISVRPGIVLGAIRVSDTRRYLRTIVFIVYETKSNRIIRCIFLPLRVFFPSSLFLFGKIAK